MLLLLIMGDGDECVCDSGILYIMGSKCPHKDGKCAKSLSLWEIFFGPHELI